MMLTVSLLRCYSCENLTQSSLREGWCARYYHGLIVADNLRHSNTVLSRLGGLCNRMVRYEHSLGGGAPQPQRCR